MKLSFSLFAMAFFGLSLSTTINAQWQEDPQTCNANPECAALGLADNCCPTTLAGIFLDCCEDQGPVCSANAGCNGLVGDCCPTADGTFLYCCFDTDPTVGGYQYDYTYFAAGRGTATGNYWRSTGQASIVGAFTHVQQYEYTRDVNSLYDTIYVTGDIPDARSYITGEKKFSITLSGTTAPPCTQVILQFEHLTKVDVAGETAVTRNSWSFDPYPKGRHSRYLATIPAEGGRIEFEFLDQPDEGVLDSEVNAVALLFAPGTYTSDNFTFYNLDSYDKCEGGEGCQASPVKACPALYVTIEGATEGRALQDCTDCANPSCMGVGDCAVGPSLANLEEDTSFAEATTATVPPTAAPTDAEGEPIQDDAEEPADEEEPVVDQEQPVADQGEPAVEDLTATNGEPESTTSSGMMSMAGGAILLALGTMLI